MIFILLPAVLLTADLVIKYYINKKKDALEGKKLLGGRARLHLMYNRGFAGSRLADHPKTVKGVSSASAVLYAALFAVILKTKGARFLKLCLAAALGGALGNTTERLAKGAVTDYLQPIRKGKRGKYVYNFADICIFIGSAAGIIAIIKELVAGWKN